MRDHKNTKETWFIRCMKAPIKFLSKAKDLYVHGMTECSGRFPYIDAPMGCPVGHLSAALPRSFSVSSTTSTSAEDYKDLVRAAYIKTYGNRVDFDVPGKPKSTVPRSRSVGMGRIHEDEPCDFGDDIPVRPNIYPRSKSYAVHRRSGVV